MMALERTVPSTYVRERLLANKKKSKNKRCAETGKSWAEPTFERATSFQDAVGRLKPPKMWVWVKKQNADRRSSSLCPFTIHEIGTNFSHKNWKNGRDLENGVERGGVRWDPLKRPCALSASSANPPLELQQLRSSHPAPRVEAQALAKCEFLGILVDIFLGIHVRNWAALGRYGSDMEHKSKQSSYKPFESAYIYIYVRFPKYQSKQTTKHGQWRGFPCSPAVVS